VVVERISVTAHDLIQANHDEVQTHYKYENICPLPLSTFFLHWSFFSLLLFFGILADLDYFALQGFRIEDMELPWNFYTLLLSEIKSDNLFGPIKLVL